MGCYFTSYRHNIISVGCYNSMAIQHLRLANSLGQTISAAQDILHHHAAHGDVWGHRVVCAAGVKPALFSMLQLQVLIDFSVSATHWIWVKTITSQLPQKIASTSQFCQKIFEVRIHALLDFVGSMQCCRDGQFTFLGSTVGMQSRSTTHMCLLENNKGGGLQCNVLPTNIPLCKKRIPISDSLTAAYTKQKKYINWTHNQNSIFACMVHSAALTVQGIGLCPPPQSYISSHSGASLIWTVTLMRVIAILSIDIINPAGWWLSQNSYERPNDYKSSHCPTT